MVFATLTSNSNKAITDRNSNNIVILAFNHETAAGMTQFADMVVDEFNDASGIEPLPHSFFNYGGKITMAQMNLTSTLNAKDQSGTITSPTTTTKTEVLYNDSIPIRVYRIGWQDTRFISVNVGLNNGWGSHHVEHKTNYHGGSGRNAIFRGGGKYYESMNYPNITHVTLTPEVKGPNKDNWFIKGLYMEYNVTYSVYMITSKTITPKKSLHRLKQLFVMKE